MKNQLALFESFPSVRSTLEMVPSVFTSQREMLIGIQQLYGPIHADVTYSSGQFWKGLPKPPICTDLSSGDTLADFTALPFASRSIPSMIIDPPFIISGQRDGSDCIINGRFTEYRTSGNLMSTYTSALHEAFRVLKSGGYLAFKCQDTVSSQRQLMTHCHVWQMAIQTGFYVEDLFILLASSRITGHWKTQKHSRKFHSFIWIFRKPRHGSKESE